MQSFIAENPKNPENLEKNPKMIFQHVGNNFRTMSKKGQVPYIELNGEQLADSNLIIQELPGRFGKKSLDEHLSEEEKAQATALHALIEDKIFW